MKSDINCMIAWKKISTKSTQKRSRGWVLLIWRVRLFIYSPIETICRDLAQWRPAARILILSSIHRHIDSSLLYATLFDAPYLYRIHNQIYILLSIKNHKYINCGHTSLRKMSIFSEMSTYYCTILAEIWRTNFKTNLHPNRSLIDIK